MSCREEAPAAPQQWFTTRLQGALKGTGVRSFVLLTKDRGCGFGFSSHCLPVLPLSAGLIDSVVSQAGGACSLPRGRARKPKPQNATLPPMSWEK